MAALALRLEDETWLFDCGEATQHRMDHSSVSAADISRIFVSHLHGDHVFGLPGLLCNIAFSASASALEEAPLTLVGFGVPPKHFRESALRNLFATSTWVSE